MSGEVILFIDGMLEAIGVSVKGGEYRAITEPSTQLSIRGPREGFTESLATNVAMVRRRIQNPHVWVEAITLGEVTQTNVRIMYIKGIANDKIVEEVRSRLRRICIDGVLESGYIEQLIEDESFTTFQLFIIRKDQIVLRPICWKEESLFCRRDTICPYCPNRIYTIFQDVEDYYARFDIATALRFYVCSFFISLVAPSVYIALTTFHQEMIPTSLVIAIAAQREAVPFPAFIEALLMEVTFEILREAGVRLPRAVGQAVSIVGALVIGQAAVEAGFVSSAMVIVVSITAIASFATPSFAIAISARLIRFALMVLAALFGFYGILIGVILMTIHLCSLRSFGVPYMAPLAPLILENIGDTFIRFPLWGLKERPHLIMNTDTVRQRMGNVQSRLNEQRKKGIQIKRYLFLIFVLLFMCIIYGCWSKRELTDLAFIIAVGIDKRDGKYMSTFQIVNPGNVAGATQRGGGSAGLPVALYTSTGDTLVEASRKASKQISRIPYYSHTNLVVIGEELAKEGIQQIFDAVERNPQFRPAANIIIARKQTAKQLLSVLTPIDKIPANQIIKTLQFTKGLLGENVDTRIREIIENFHLMEKKWS